MDTSTIIAMTVAAVDFVVLLIGVVWAVGKIKTSIDNLDTVVDGLSKAIERIESLQNAHETRISILEDRDDRDSSCPNDQPPYRPASSRRRREKKDI